MFQSSSYLRTIEVIDIDLYLEGSHGLQIIIGERLSSHRWRYVVTMEGTVGARIAGKSNPVRYKRFQEEVLGDTLVRFDGKHDVRGLLDKGCRLCFGQSFDVCMDATRLKTCKAGCGFLAGRKCLVEWAFERGWCPICETRID